MCACTPEAVRRYRGRLSGPFLDRIDMHLEVPRLGRSALRDGAAGESSATVAARVRAARALARERQGRANARLDGSEVEGEAHCDCAALARLDAVVDALGLSARAYHRVLRVARTIADLAGAARVTEAHVAEAIAYRALDRPAAEA